jgi:hypothetical protein
MNTFAALALLALLCALCAGFAPVQNSDIVRFEAVDIFVDGGALPLAAWQVELVDPTGRATIAGVEGGEHAAYAAPPYYDPRALMQGRIVLAAFSLEDELPLGRTRVARLHVRVVGTQDVTWKVELVAAGDRHGDALDGNVELTRSR